MPWSALEALEGVPELWGHKYVLIGLL
jgi:hypothetical protein